MTRQLLTDDMRRRLVEAREASYPSQAALARKIGVSKVSMNRWERGWCRPSLGALERWCEALGLTLKVEIE